MVRLYFFYSVRFTEPFFPADLLLGENAALGVSNDMTSTANGMI